MAPTTLVARRQLLRLSAGRKSIAAARFEVSEMLATIPGSICSQSCAFISRNVAKARPR